MFYCSSNSAVWILDTCFFQTALCQVIDLNVQDTSFTKLSFQVTQRQISKSNLVHDFLLIFLFLIGGKSQKLCVSTIIRKNVSFDLKRVGKEYTVSSLCKQMTSSSERLVWAVIATMSEPRECLMMIRVCLQVTAGAHDSHGESTFCVCVCVCYCCVWSCLSWGCRPP